MTDLQTLTVPERRPSDEIAERLAHKLAEAMTPVAYREIQPMSRQQFERETVLELKAFVRAIIAEWDCDKPS